MGSWVVSQAPPPIPGVKARKAWLAERPSEIGQIVPIQSGRETLGERVGIVGKMAAINFERLAKPPQKIEIRFESRLCCFFKDSICLHQMVCKGLHQISL